MAVKKSTRGQVTAVVDILGHRIAAGDYAEGETLPVEQELADSLKVGRNALREAVKVLSGKGLISTAARSGTRIRLREDWNMLDPDVLRWHADPDIATEKFMLDGRHTGTGGGNHVIIGGATPQDKFEYVVSLQAAGARVAMIGDGLNDAPVLARADLSVALGGGADAALVLNRRGWHNPLRTPRSELQRVYYRFDGDSVVRGYWQALDKSSFSHMARGLNALGVSVAVPSYDLCPNVRIGDIVEIRLARHDVIKFPQRVRALHRVGGEILHGF